MKNSIEITQIFILIGCFFEDLVGFGLDQSISDAGIDQIDVLVDGSGYQRDGRVGTPRHTAHCALHFKRLHTTASCNLPNCEKIKKKQDKNIIIRARDRFLDVEKSKI